MEIRRDQRGWLRNSSIVALSVLVIVAVYRFTGAGSLTPPAAPAGTFNDLGGIYGALASDSFDSSSVTASASGSILGISKCIINRLAGGTCP